MHRVLTMPPDSVLGMLSVLIGVTICVSSKV
jgi:hypothetical protein